MDITTIFGALTVIVGGICVMILVSTKTLRDSRDDQEKRIKQLEEERVRDKAQIGSLTTEVRFWRSAATGDEKLDKISALLDRHHADAVKNWIQVNAGLGHVGQTLDHVVESIDQLVATLGGDPA
jgi:peptidoglycan hydrolase CwlO-like protein